MSAYDNYPKGVYLVGSHKVAGSDAKLLAGADFVVGHMGAGLKRTANFTDHIQTAADAGRPFLAYYENDPEQFVAQYQTLNLAHWLKTPGDNWLVKDVVKPSLFSGGVLRTVHGVVIGMNKLMETSGKTIPVNWVLDCARFLKTVIEGWGIPVFFYIDPEQAAKLPHGAADEFTTFLGGKDSNGNYNLPGISTFFNAYGAGAAVAASWDALPTPDDAYTAALRQMKLDSGLGNAKQLEFVCYSAGRFTLPGISGNTVPLFYYTGSVAGLYTRLKFTVPQQPEQPETPEEPEQPEQPETPETPEQVDEVEGLLLGALAKGLDAFAAAWLKGRGSLGGGE